MRATFFIVITSFLIFQSCSSTRMLKQQRDYSIALNDILISDIDAETKVDEVAKVFNDVLQESMGYSSSKNTWKHIEQFTENNKQTLGLIMDQIEEHMNGLGVVQQIAFTIAILKKPYIKSFRDLVPKVEKKINRKLKQIRLFGRFLSILKPNVF